MVETEFVFDLENVDIKSDEDLIAIIKARAAEQQKEKGLDILTFDVLKAGVEADQRVHAVVKMRVAGKTEVPIAEIEAKLPILSDELVRLVHVIFHDSVLPDGTPLFWLSIVDVAIRTTISKYGIRYYCGPDSGKRPGKRIVLAIFQSMDEFFRGVRYGKKLAENTINENETLHKYIVDHRPQPEKSPTETVTKLLELGSVPLTPEIVMKAIDLWVCNPVVLARTIDRLLQGDIQPINDENPAEPLSEDGAAALGSVQPEEYKEEFSETIGRIIQSIVKSSGVNKGLELIQRFALFAGGRKLIGSLLDDSLNPNIDMDTMIAKALQKLMSNVQSEGMLNNDCVNYFYGTVLPEKLKTVIPRIVMPSVQKIVDAVTVVFKRAELMREMVYYYVMPALIAALEDLLRDQQAKPDTKELK